MKNGKVHSYETFGAVDGPGIRFIVFLQGCPLRCLYCHNPDTWDPTDGTETTVEEIVKKVLPYRGFYKGGGGVTISGGEPMAQHEFVRDLLRALKKENIHTAIDTSGAIPLSVCREAIDEADMLLLDIKSILPDLSKTITGSATVLANEKEYLDYCESVGKDVWIRHVVVPGLTMDEEQLRTLREFLDGYSCVKRIEPLPFHKLGEHKWEEGCYTLSATEQPTKEEMAKVDAILKKI
ncbi:MAG: pyruvate formate lyase-activating protein [Oscillospiraceae bacterium]|nr:pyruvate formate lyase-activating protein [Oscillospiraceae bacterium]